MKIGISGTNYKVISMRGFLKNFDILLRLKVIGGILTALTLLGFLARFHVLMEMIVCFRVSYFYLLLFCSVPFFFKKEWLWASAFLAASLINFFQFGHLYFEAEKSDTAATDRILIFNVYSANKNYQALIDYINKTDPDHIVLVEVNSRWASAINDGLREKYPHSVVVPRIDNFGILLRSKKPFESEIIDLYGVPVISAQFDKFKILAVHPLPPRNGIYFEDRNKQLKMISDLIQPDKNTMICGDLNTVPWSPFFKDFVSQNNLKMSSKGQGVCTTWPTNIPFLRIPIDHSLLTTEGNVQIYQRGPDLGSDHFPLLIDFSFN